ncbi:winged helix-turn-helix transcriptional regulator [Rhodococcus qingshengii]|uniref:winged helix-turn-helix transcriptional regulator n=1 Tax=Rhodococcus qingshengii TaxID=334542 RepID=UPI001E617CC1|nr:winged helix-turn-helix transcriptional regulator [Rhodococcus qingshengii]MCD2134540.1 winged helix-turn-helix transcriptional regulator [Rhodococcus qingshengii]
MALSEAEIRQHQADAAAAAAQARGDAAARAERLAAAAATRKVMAEVAEIRRRYPPHVHWLDVWDATRYVNRSAKTLHRWVRLGIVKTGRRRGELLFDQYSLAAARIYMDGRRRASQIDGTTIVAGPGRPKDLSAREEIVNLLVADSSMSNREIARRVGVSHTLVSSVRREWQ